MPGNYATIWGQDKVLEQKIESKTSSDEVRQIVTETMTEKNDHFRKIAKEIFEDGTKGNKEVW